MISYELAKQLKEAGFPRDFGDGWAMFLTNEEEGIISTVPWWHYVYKPNDPPAIYVPTLEELIEACGDVEDLDIIRRFVGGSMGVEWRVTLTKHVDLEEIVITDFGGMGSTPSEAVAKLWLALRKELDE